MVRRAGIRRFVRWGGVALVVVLPLVWGASLLRFAIYINEPDGFGFGIAKGALEYYRDYPTSGTGLRTWIASPYDQSTSGPLVWLASFSKSGPVLSLLIPIWIPWLLAAGFTAWRFRADWLTGSDTCGACGYDRRGLAVGSPCPECGNVPV